MTELKREKIIKETGFSPAGLYGREYDLMSTMTKKGYEVLYETAPYNWGMHNDIDMSIFTYTEGDTATIKYRSWDEYVNEKQRYKEFAMTQ